MEKKQAKQELFGLEDEAETMPEGLDGLFQRVAANRCKISKEFGFGRLLLDRNADWT